MPTFSETPKPKKEIPESLGSCWAHFLPYQPPMGPRPEVSIAVFACRDGCFKKDSSPGDVLTFSLLQRAVGAIRAMNATSGSCEMMRPAPTPICTEGGQMFTGPSVSIPREGHIISRCRCDVCVCLQGHPPT